MVLAWSVSIVNWNEQWTLKLMQMVCTHNFTYSLTQPHSHSLTLPVSLNNQQKKNVKISIFSFWLAKISPCMWWYTHIYLMKRTLSLLTLKESDFLVAYSEIQYPQCLLTIMITRNQSDDDQWYTGCFLPIRSRDNFRLQNFRRSLYRY